MTTARARARQKRVPPINRYSSPSSACDPPPCPISLLPPPTRLSFLGSERRDGEGEGAEGAGELCQGSCLRGALHGRAPPTLPSCSLTPTNARLSPTLSLSLLSPSKIPFSLSSLLGPFLDLSLAPNTPVPAAEIPPRFPPVRVISSNLTCFLLFFLLWLLSSCVSPLQSEKPPLGNKCHPYFSGLRFDRIPPNIFLTLSEVGSIA
ncbi:hypothetical protein VPH35_051567 [Triticum aestivum]